MPNEFTEIEGAAAPSSQPSPSSEKLISSQGRSASFADLTDKVAEDVSAAKDTIRQGADTAVEKVKEAVSEHTSFGARQVGGVATALEKVGAELEGSDQHEVGRYARQIGRSVRRVAKQIEGKNVGEIATIAEEFGRKQPLAFLGIAALAGLTASRFLTASAKRSTKVTLREQSSTAGSRYSTTGGGDNG
jgi:hypothetical protein